MNKNRKQNYRISDMPDIVEVSGNFVIAGIRATLFVPVLCIVQTGPVLAEAEMDDVTPPTQGSNVTQDSTLTGSINMELLFIVLLASGLEFTMDTLRESNLDSPGS